MSELRVGAVGTLRNGDNVLHGGIQQDNGVTFTIRIDGLPSSNVFHHGYWEFTPDVSPVLTRPGMYEDRDGDIWKVWRDGRLVCLTAPGGSDNPEEYAPFTRLVPEVTP